MHFKGLLCIIILGRKIHNFFFSNVNHQQTDREEINNQSESMGKKVNQKYAFSFHHTLNLYFYERIEISYKNSYNQLYFLFSLYHFTEICLN